MPIHTECACGQKLSIPSAHAGKKVKCPKCGKVLAVPLAGGPADGPRKPAEKAPPSGGGSINSDEQASMESAATAGPREIDPRRLPHGKATVKSTPAPAADRPTSEPELLPRRTGLSTEEETPGRAALPIRRIVILGIVVAIGLGAYVAYKSLAGSREFDQALHEFECDQISQAVSRMQNYAASVSGADKAAADLWVAQMQLERLMKREKWGASSERLQMTNQAGYVGDPTSPTLVVRVSIMNRTDAPMVLKTQHLYLWGPGAITLPGAVKQDHKVEVTRHDVPIAPGATGEATLVFLSLPDVESGRRKTTFLPFFSVVYNDGQTYLKQPLTSKD